MGNLVESLVSSFLGGNNTKSLSEKTGASENQVQTIIEAALPVLVQSMANNSQDEKGAKSLAGALSDHAKKKESVEEQIQNADVEDGNKILGHLLGSNKTAVEKDIAKSTGLKQNQVGNLLSTIAPVLLSQMGKQTSSKDSGGLDLGNLLGSFLGGGSDSSSNNLLDSVVGAVFSGGSKSSSKKKDSSDNDLLSSLMGLITGK